MELVVQGTEDLATHIKGFTLADPSGAPLPAFAPGSHIKVAVRNGEGEAATRSYSLYNDPSEGRYRIAVLLDEVGDGGSRFMHDSVHAGDHIDCTVPVCDFALDANVSDSILIAGGIGITPILSMVRKLAESKESFAVHYGAKTNAHMALRDELIAQADGRCAVYLDGGDSARGLSLASILRSPKPGTRVYVCGPSGLIDATIAVAAEKGWKSDQIRFERFAAPTVQSDDAAFAVTLAQSGETLDIAVDQTILSALIDAGVDPLYDCGSGNCGLCVQTVVAVDGDIDHRDAFLSDQQRQEGDQMCVCVSRIKGKSITLDL